MLKMGIIGCGHIARKMANTVKEMKNASIYAVASRSKEKAENFAAEFGIEKAYGSYEELCADNSVDLIYIATPMSEHRNNMLLALRNGKNVLCEKSFTVNQTEAEEVIAEARKHNTYLAEAIWTRYMPSRKIINEIISSGRIGKVTSITADLGYCLTEKERVINPALGGGALLDIGIYALNFALMAEDGKLLKSITGSAVKNENGVDIKESITLIFEDDVQALLLSDATALTDRRGLIYGTDGYIEVTNINNPERIAVYSGYRSPELTEEHIITHEINGFEYQIEAAANAIADGKKEAEAMPLSETLRVMRIMDALRGLWDVKLGSELQ